MRKGWTVTNFYNNKGMIILVDNYNSSNRVANYGCVNLNNYILNNAIGVWKIKKLNETKN